MKTTFARYARTLTAAFAALALIAMAATNANAATNTAPLDNPAIVQSDTPQANVNQTDQAINSQQTATIDATNPANNPDANANPATNESGQFTIINNVAAENAPKNAAELLANLNAANAANDVGTAYNLRV